VPIISILDVVAEAIQRQHPKIKIVGLLGTSGTVLGGTFQKRLAVDGIKTVVPDDCNQTLVMEAIYDIKKAQPDRSSERIMSDLVAVCEFLIMSGAQGIIAGCTEIPLALKQDDLNVPYFDPVLALAREAILRCGLEPLSPDKNSVY
jgi:aspartate racemase